MPELPEVEHFRRMLLPLVSGSSSSSSNNNTSSSNNILRIKLLGQNHNKKFLTPEEVIQLNNAQLMCTKIERRGKLMCMTLVPIVVVNAATGTTATTATTTTTKQQQQEEQERYLYVHMGMTGRITTPDRVACFGHIDSQWVAPELYPPKFSYLQFTNTTTGFTACFSDPRKFGYVRLVTTKEELLGLAPDAMTETAIACSSSVDDGGGGGSTNTTAKTKDAKDAVWSNRSTGIKSLLLDQKRIVSGIGNWVADEVLYQTQIHPNQNYLTVEESHQVSASIHSVLETACTSSDTNSSYPKEWLFHYRWGKGKKKGSGGGGGISKDYHGRAIKFIDAAGRTSAIIPSLQVLKKQNRGPTKTATKKKKTATKVRVKSETTSTDVVAPTQDNDDDTVVDKMKIKKEETEEATSPPPPPLTMTMTTRKKAIKKEEPTEQGQDEQKQGTQKSARNTKEDNSNNNEENQWILRDNDAANDNIGAGDTIIATNNYAVDDDPIEEENEEERKKKRKEDFENRRDDILSRIPDAVKGRFGEICFAKFGKFIGPVIILSPYCVAPGTVRENWLEMFNSCQSSGKPMTHLAYWYGCSNDLMNAYSFQKDSQLMSYETGLEKIQEKIDKLRRKKEQQLNGEDGGKASLSTKDTNLLNGMDELELDRKKMNPSERCGYVGLDFFEEYHYQPHDPSASSFLMVEGGGEQNDDDNDDDSPTTKKKKQRRSKIKKSKKPLTQSPDNRKLMKTSTTTTKEENCGIDGNGKRARSGSRSRQIIRKRSKRKQNIGDSSS